MTPAAAILARAEAAGVLLRLTPEGEMLMEGLPPPPGLVAEIRRYWDALRSVLKARLQLGTVLPPGWLERTAQAIHAAARAGAGARPQMDPEGWLYIATADGGQITVAPDTLWMMAEAGLLRRPEAEAAEDAGAGPEA
jgi:hypothetical protein